MYLLWYVCSFFTLSHERHLSQPNIPQVLHSGLLSVWQLLKAGQSNYFVLVVCWYTLFLLNIKRKVCSSTKLFPSAFSLGVIEHPLKYKWHCLKTVFDSLILRSQLSNEILEIHAQKKVLDLATWNSKYYILTTRNLNA